MMRTKNPLQQKMLMQKHGTGVAERQVGAQVTQGAAQEGPRSELQSFAAGGKEQPVGLWPVFEALNVLGSQGWSINSHVLRVRLLATFTLLPLFRGFLVR